jgi:hypothetical protein
MTSVLLAKENLNELLDIGYDEPSRRAFPVRGVCVISEEKIDIDLNCPKIWIPLSLRSIGPDISLYFSKPLICNFFAVECEESILKLEHFLPDIDYLWVKSVSDSVEQTILKYGLVERGKINAETIFSREKDHYILPGYIDSKKLDKLFEDKFQDFDWTRDPDLFSNSEKEEDDKPIFITNRPSPKQNFDFGSNLR